MWRHNYGVAVAFGLLLLIPGTAVGDDRPLDVTIKILESPTDTPEEVTKTIALPPAATRDPAEASRSGRDVGRDTRDAGGDHRLDRGRGPGGGIADDVRRQGDRGKGKDMSDARGRGRP